MSQETQDSFSAHHRWSGWLNLLFAGLAVLILATTLNYLSHRNYNRNTWAENLENDLSPRTLELLAQISHDVEIIIFFDRTEPTYRMVDELLQKYAQLNPRLKIRSVDPLEQPKQALEILAQYRLTSQQRNVIIFSANQQHKILSNGQLSQFETKQVSAEELSNIQGEQTDQGGFVMQRTAFLGERLFTSALRTVSSTLRPHVYCVTGHGEHSITNITSTDGYGQFGQLLGEMNAQVSDLELNRAHAVPANCDLLILPGPKTDLNTQEQHMVDQYLKQGGRLLMLVGHRSVGGLEDVLQRWGLNVGNNTVIDPENTLGDGSLSLRQYWAHPVVQSLQREELPVRLLLPRTVSGQDQDAIGLKVTPLMYTGEQGNAWRDYRQRAPGMEPTLEHTGALPVAAAVELDTLAGVKSDTLARLVVVGDSTFLSNRMIHIEGNRELAWHSVNWLLDRSDQLLSIGPQPIETYTIEFKGNDFVKMASIIGIFMPAGTLLFGGFIWLRRRT